MLYHSNQLRCVVFIRVFPRLQLHLAHPLLLLSGRRRHKVHHEKRGLLCLPLVLLHLDANPPTGNYVSGISAARRRFCNQALPSVWSIARVFEKIPSEIAIVKFDNWICESCRIKILCLAIWRPPAAPPRVRAIAQS